MSFYSSAHHAPPGLPSPLHVPPRPLFPASALQSPHLGSGRASPSSNAFGSQQTFPGSPLPSPHLGHAGLTGFASSGVVAPTPGYAYGQHGTGPRTPVPLHAHGSQRGALDSMVPPPPPGPLLPMPDGLTVYGGQQGTHGAAVHPPPPGNPVPVSMLVDGGQHGAHGAMPPPHGHGAHRGPHRTRPPPSSGQVAATPSTTLGAHLSGAGGAAVATAGEMALALLERESSRGMTRREVTDIVEKYVDVLKADMLAVVAAKIETSLAQYAAVVDSFKSECAVVQFIEGGLSHAAASANGMVYFRINEVDISSLTADLDKLRLDARTGFDQMGSRIKDLESRPVAASAPSAPAGSGGVGTDLEKAYKGRQTKHRYKHASRWLREELARQAGLPAGRNKADKIYHHRWVHDLPEYHPTTYRAHPSHPCVEGVPEGQPALYRKIRFDWKDGFEASHNWRQLAGPVKHLLDNRSAYHLPDDFDEADVKERILKQLWRNWVSESKLWFDLPATERIRREKEEKRKMRHRKMRATKAANRLKAAKVLGHALDTDKMHPAVFQPEYQSDEETDEEVDPRTQARRGIRVRREPEFRSSEGTAYLRSLDAGRVTTSDVQDRTALAPLGEKLKHSYPPWAIRQRWYDHAPESKRPKMFATNRGPWAGDGSLVASPSSFGSGAFDPAPSHAHAASAGPGVRAEDGSQVSQSSSSNSGDAE